MNTPNSPAVSCNILFKLGVKAGVSERVNISCPTCGTHHDALNYLENSPMSQFVNKPLNICDTELSNV